MKKLTLNRVTAHSILKKHICSLIFATLAVGGIVSCGDDDNATESNSTSTPHPNSNPFFNIEMASVAGGTFFMGTQCSDASAANYDSMSFEEFEAPVHQVTLSNFKISKYEVTQKLWKAVMTTNPSQFIGDSLPVEQVSWDDVQIFLQRLNDSTGKNYRLPTEAEWEFAARGGNQSNGYLYSGSNTLTDVAWCLYNSGSRTHQVGTKSANELGIFDMTGNVWEWCSDWYGTYMADAQTNPHGPNYGPTRIIRGSSWKGAASACRISWRINNCPDISVSIGFRIVLDN